MRLSDTLVPTRFLCTIGHLVLLVMIFYTKEKNINAALGDNFTSDEFDEKNRSYAHNVLLPLVLAHSC